MPNCPDPRSEYQRELMRILWDQLSDKHKREIVADFHHLVNTYDGAVQGMLTDVELYANEGEK